VGRRDGVQVVLEVVARMRAIEPRLVVSYEPGWETRGNGTSANYEGALVHHTASASSLANPFPTQRVLRDGRPDLSGPLCNFAGPACTVDAPRLHVMSANPANHAGASGGRSMGPLPVTSLFNPRVLGLEIDYAGTVAMLAGQLYVGHLFGRAAADVVGGGDIERVRAHFETSVTGKWDIGAGAGTKTYDMAAFRLDAAAITTAPIPAPEEYDMPNFVGYRNDDKQGGDGECVLAAPGYWIHVVNPGYRDLYVNRGVVEKFQDVNSNEFAHFRDYVYLAAPAGSGRTTDMLSSLAAQVAGIKPADVDEDALAAILAPKLTGATKDEIAEALRDVLRDGVGA